MKDRQTTTLPTLSTTCFPKKYTTDTNSLKTTQSHQNDGGYIWII